MVYTKAGGLLRNNLRVGVSGGQNRDIILGIQTTNMVGVFAHELVIHPVAGRMKPSICCGSTPEEKIKDSFPLLMPTYRQIYHSFLSHMLSFVKRSEVILGNEGCLAENLG